ncbi:MAG: hypothetical protein L0Z55_05250 [Planctomycetes bacterium]|nr:hypothetical protein [Planctomycetota bacterium]
MSRQHGWRQGYRAWCVRRPLVAAALALLALFALAAGCNSSGGGGGAAAAGVTSGELPDCRVFVIDALDGTVRVVDGNSPRQEGVSPALPLPGGAARGVALDPHGDRIWITQPDTDVAAVFDAATMALVATVATGDQPGAIFVDGANGRVYIANESADSVTVRAADPPFAELGGSPIAVGDVPIDLLVIGSALIVANRDSDTISRFDAAPPFVEAAGSPFAAGDAPADLEQDASQSLVFVANRAAGSISVFDVATNVLTTPITGLSEPVQLARHARADLLFVADGASGSLRAYSSIATPVEQSGSPVAIGGTAGGVYANTFLDRVFVTNRATRELRTYSAIAPFPELDPALRPQVGTLPGRSAGVEPVVLRTLLAAGGSAVQGSAAQGSLLYIAHGTAGMRTVDLTNPRASLAAAEVATLLLPDSAIAVEVEGEFAFLSNGANGIQIADISAPAAPVVVQTADGIGTTDEIFLFGQFLLVDVGTAGLVVLDVLSPEFPLFVASVNPGGNAAGFAFSSEHRFAYSASGGTDLFVLDLLNPAQPFLAETISIPVDAEDVATLPGRVAAVAANAGGLRLVRVSPVSGSQLAGQVDLGVAARKVTAIFDLALVTDANGDLHVVNAASAAHPHQIGFLDLAAEPKEIRVFGNDLYLAEGTSGLVIIRFFP